MTYIMEADLHTSANSNLQARRILAVLLSASILLAVGCAGGPAQQSEEPIQADGADQPVEGSVGSERSAGILPEMLQKAGLDVHWTLNLPLGRASYLKRVFHRDAAVYALSSSNRLTAVDGKSGRTLWTRDLGQPYAACSAVSYYDDRMLFVVADTVVEIRRTDGAITRRIELSFHAATNAVRSGDRLYIGGADKRFYCLRLADGVPLWMSVCPEEPTGTVATDEENVYFVCKDGSVYVSALNKRSLKWEQPTAGLSAGVIVDRDQCLMASMDTALYCFRPDSGKLLWKYLAGGSLSQLPVATETAIYQPVEHASLLCLNRQNDADRRLRWALDNGLALLAENGHLSYAITRDRKLTVMDNRTGKRVVSFYVQQLGLHAENTQDAMIYMADKAGLLLALKPRSIDGL